MESLEQTLFKLEELMKRVESQLMSMTSVFFYHCSEQDKRINAYDAKDKYQAEESAEQNKRLHNIEQNLKELSGNFTAEMKKISVELVKFKSEQMEIQSQVEKNISNVEAYVDKLQRNCNYEAKLKLAEHRIILNDIRAKLDVMEIYIIAIDTEKRQYNKETDESITEQNMTSFEKNEEKQQDEISATSDKENRQMGEQLDNIQKSLDDFKVQINETQTQIDAVREDVLTKIKCQTDNIATTFDEDKKALEKNILKELTLDKIPHQSLGQKSNLHVQQDSKFAKEKNPLQLIHINAQLSEIMK